MNLKNSPSNLRWNQVKRTTQSSLEFVVSISTLYTWISKLYNEQTSDLRGVVDDKHFYEELKQLRRENARPKEEWTPLKKAATFFAKKSIWGTRSSRNIGVGLALPLCAECLRYLTAATMSGESDHPVSEPCPGWSGVDGQYPTHHEKSPLTYGIRRIQKNWPQTVRS